MTDKLNKYDHRLFRLIQAVLTSQHADALKHGRPITDAQYNADTQRLDRRALVALRDIRELILRESEMIDIVLQTDPFSPNERFIEVERNGKGFRLGWDIFRDGEDGGIQGRTIRFNAILPTAPNDLPLNEEDAV